MPLAPQLQRQAAARGAPDDPAAEEGAVAVGGLQRAELLGHALRVVEVVIVELHHVLALGVVHGAVAQVPQLGTDRQHLRVHLRHTHTVLGVSSA